MISSIHNNASALQAFSRQMATSANNVANALSDDFKAQRAYNTEGENGSVTTYISKTNSPAPLVESPYDGSLKELSNTDIAEELVQQISIQHGFEANAKAIQTQEETLGTFIDLMG